MVLLLPGNEKQRGHVLHSTFVEVSAPELLCRVLVMLAVMTNFVTSAMLFPLQLGVFYVFGWWP